MHVKMTWGHALNDTKEKRKFSQEAGTRVKFEQGLIKYYPLIFIRAIKPGQTMYRRFN